MAPLLLAIGEWSITITHGIHMVSQMIGGDREGFAIAVPIRTVDLVEMMGGGLSIAVAVGSLSHSLFVRLISLDLTLQMKCSVARSQFIGRLMVQPDLRALRDISLT